MGLSCLPGISRVGTERKRSVFGHKINPFLTKLVRLRWMDIVASFVFAFLLTSTSSRSIKMQKKTWPISSHLDLTFAQ